MCLEQVFRRFALKATDPRGRILEAACELFGEKGFKATTIREICKNAEVSLALVNYHFKSKQALYEEILLTALENAFGKNPVQDFIKPDMSPEEKLRNVIRLLMHRLLGETGLGSNPHTVMLVAKELTNPSDIMDKIYTYYLEGMITTMIGVLVELVGDIDREDLVRFASSIAGQCLHPLLAKCIIHRAGFELGSNVEDIEKHAEHIYKFSLNGIKGYQI